MPIKRSVLRVRSLRNREPSARSGSTWHAGVLLRPSFFLRFAICREHRMWWTERCDRLFAGVQEASSKRTGRHFPWASGR